MTRYHGKDLRKGRISELGRPYIITSVTNRRRPLFLDWPIARLLVSEMRNVTEVQRVDTLAWVIMPNHFHWLLMLEHGALEEVIRHVKSRSAIAINRRLGTQGRIWQRGFHDLA